MESLDPGLELKDQHLIEMLFTMESVGVALSGGVDIPLLAKAAAEFLWQPDFRQFRGGQQDWAERYPPC